VLYYGKKVETVMVSDSTNINKTKKVETVMVSDSTNINRDLHSTHIHDPSLCWLGTGTSQHTYT
jgi:hypothetical protein